MLASKGTSIILEWVLSYIGIYSDKLANSLAKEAIKKDLGNYLKALVLIGIDIKNTINKE